MESEAVFIDCDLRFNLQRFVNILISRLGEVLPAHCQDFCTSRQAIPSSVNSCLTRLHVINCMNFIDVLCALRQVHDFVHRNETRCIRLVVLDSISAFFWQDRASQEADGQNKFLNGTLFALKQLMAEQSILCLASKATLFSKRGNGGGRSQSDIMGKTWQRMVKYSFELYRKGEFPNLQIGARFSVGSAREWIFTVCDSGVVFSPLNTTC